MKFKTVKITTICLISFAHVSVANPSVWYVDAARQNDDGPGDTPETAWQIIQTAINNAAEGDTILVAPGIYDQGGSVAEGVTNRVNFTKPLILKAISTNPADTVIVGAPDPETERGTGPNAVRGVYLLGNATLSGFTITNGHTGVSGYGGGVLSQNNSSTISNCVITGSTADRDGGGTSGGTIFKSIIEGNRAYRYGGGTRSGKIVNSEIRSVVSGLKPR